MDLVAPWSEITDVDTRVKIESELRREIAEGHALSGEPAIAVAQRDDHDDILFALADGRWAIVHLTWHVTRESDPRWPSAEILPTEAALSERLHKDAEEFG